MEKGIIGTVKILLSNIETLPKKIEGEKPGFTLHMFSPLVDHSLHVTIVDLEVT